MMKFDDCNATSCDRQNVPSVLPKRVWSKSGDYSGAFLLYREGKVISRLLLYDRMLTLEGIEIDVVGFGRVWTAPDLRGRGYATYLLDHALTMCSSGRHVAAVLFSRPRVLYRRLGFINLVAANKFESLFGKSLMENVGLSSGPWRLDPEGHF